MNLSETLGKNSNSKADCRKQYKQIACGKGLWFLFRLLVFVMTTNESIFETVRVLFRKLVKFLFKIW